MSAEQHRGVSTSRRVNAQATLTLPPCSSDSNAPALDVVTALVLAGEEFAAGEDDAAAGIELDDAGLDVGFADDTICEVVTGAADVAGAAVGGADDTIVSGAEFGDVVTGSSDVTAVGAVDEVGVTDTLGVVVDCRTIVVVGVD